MVCDSIYLFFGGRVPFSLNLSLLKEGTLPSHCFPGPSWPLSEISPDCLWQKGQFFDTRVYIVGLTFSSPTHKAKDTLLSTKQQGIPNS